METGILVLASGRGSNFEHLLAEHARRPFRARFVGLIVDRSNTGAETIAHRAGIPVCTIEFADFPNRKEFDAALFSAALDFNPGLIVGAGFMRILDSVFVGHFAHRIVNLHPSLLPAFPGLHPQRQALEKGVKVSGCTVHFMDSGVDTGPIILQKALEIPEECSEEELTELIRNLEHALLPQAVRLFCEGRLRVDGNRVRILEEMTY